MDVTLRQGAPVVVRPDAGAVRGQLRHGQAGPVRQGGDVCQAGSGPRHHGADGHGPRLQRGRGLGAPLKRRAPGVRHGQAQDDDGRDGGVREGGGPGLGGAGLRGGERRGDGGGGAPVQGAHRRRDLAHGVRQQLPAGEGGVPGAAGAAAPRVRLLQQSPRPGPDARAHQKQRAPVAARAHGAGQAHGHHRRAPGRRQGGQGARHRPAWPHARGQRRRRRRPEGHEHGRDHRRVQDVLLRRPRHDGAPPHLGHVPPRHAPRVAAAAQGGGAPGVRRRRDAPPRRLPQQAQAGNDGTARDAEAVRPGQRYREEGDGGHGRLRSEGAQGHRPVDPVRDAAPRRRCVGPGRRRVQPAPVPGRRGQGGHAPERAAGLLARPTVVHWAGLRDAGGEGHAGADPAAVRVRGGAGVRARAGRLADASAPARAPRRAQARLTCFGHSVVAS